MTQLLKKLSDSHYVVVTDEPIKEGDYNVPSDFWDISITSKECLEIVNNKSNGYKKIVASTKPLEETDRTFMSVTFGWNKIQRLDLSYIKSLVGEVDLDKKAEEKYPYEVGYGVSDENIRIGELQGAYVNGYKQCLEDNKDKRFSEEDMRKAIEMAREGIVINRMSEWDTEKEFDYTDQQIISSLTQPKDTWECEFIDGQLKLK